MAEFVVNSRRNRPGNRVILILVICNKTKDYFSWEPEKINVKFHKNCENTAKILKISCVRCNFVKFDFHFLGLP